MKVGIVLPIYNEEEQVLADCLESIEAQTLRDFRLVIVVDGADNRTIPSVNKAVTKLSMPFVILHNLEHRGTPDSLNEGLAELTDCEFTTWISCDNRYDPNYIQSLLNAMEQPQSEVPPLQSPAVEQIIPHPPLVSVRVMPRSNRKKRRKPYPRKPVRSRRRNRRHLKDRRKLNRKINKRMLPKTGKRLLPKTGKAPALPNKKPSPTILLNRAILPSERNIRKKKPTKQLIFKMKARRID